MFCILSSELSLKEEGGSTVYMLSVSSLVSGGGGAPLYAVPVSCLVSGDAGGFTVCMLSVSYLVSCSDSNKSFTFPFENRKNIHRFTVSPNGLLMITVDKGQLISSSTRKPLL